MNTSHHASSLPVYTHHKDCDWLSMLFLFLSMLSVLKSLVGSLSNKLVHCVDFVKNVRHSLNSVERFPAYHTVHILQ